MSCFAIVATGVLFQLSCLAAEPVVETHYVAYRFDAAEGWRATSSGDRGRTALTGRQWTVDFSRDARWVGLAPPDTALLGTVSKIRLLVRGSAKGHPIHLFLRTHFMTFHKLIGEIEGEGEQEITTDGPPGPGWQWTGGENDGRIHGPLRMGEIRLEANGLKDQLQLELIRLTVDGTAPDERRCVMVARTVEAEETIRSLAEVRCLSQEPLDGRLSWTVRDWERHTLGRGERRVSIPPDAQRLAVEVPLGRIDPDRKFLATEFQLEIPGQVVPASETSWVRKQEALDDASLQPESPLGMVLALDRYPEDEMEHAARMAREAGVKWMRQSFSWGRIEPERGRFDWAYYDNLAACARRNGISTYALVSGWAPWTRPYSEEGIEDYLVFLKQLVAHYKERIHHWEIWNEPNIFFWQGPKEMYGSLLIKSYAAVKEVDASAQVLGLSTAGIDYRFISQMLAQHVPFDILTIHPYRKVLDDERFIDDLRKVSDLVLLPNGRRRPVWITEMGWSTFTPHNALTQDFSPVTLREQAQLLARAYLCALVSGVVSNIAWYDFRNDGEEPLYFEHELGVVSRDFRAKPAYYTLMTLARVLKGKQLAGRVDVGNGTFAYRFTGAGGTAIALWNPSSDAGVDLQVPTNRAVLFNTVGESKSLQTTGKGHERSVHVSLHKGASTYLVF